MPSISVIVPIYNASKYIRRCIDSIIAQTFKEWRLLLIDDGSCDDSLSIIKDYEIKDKRITVFSKENEGVSLTRQYGLDRVETPYFIFCDADDYVEHDFLEKLFESIKNGNADIAICEYQEDYKDYSKKKIIPNTNYIDYVKNLLTTKIWGVTWNKLYRTDIIRNNEIAFIPKLQMWEDLAFNIDYCMHAENVAFVNKCLYHYVQYNNESITKHENVSKKEDRVTAVHHIDKALKDANKSAIYYREMLWLKYLIKDHFITSEYTKEGIAIWKSYFPEVNGKYREIQEKRILHFLLLKNQDWVLLLIQKYRNTRYAIHQALKTFTNHICKNCSI